jgi:Fe2+ transport system protein B
MTKEVQMSRLVSFCVAAALLVCAAGAGVVQADHRAATLAVIRRETNSWGWAAFTFFYMTVLAYAGAFAAYRFGMMLS